MRVLHLYSNYKWTGPSEPAVSLAVGLKALGADVVLRSSAYTKGNDVNYVADQADARGLAPITDLALAKHRSPLRDWRDVRRLRAILAEDPFDLIHCHLPNDHQIAARAVGAAGPLLVRTLYDTDPRRLPGGDLSALSRARRVFVFSEQMAQALLARGVEGSRLVRIEAAVDLERFRPAEDGPNARAELGLGVDDYVAGIVARVQPQRRFDLLLDIAEEVSRVIPEFRLLVIGRGSKLEQTARDPARRRGLLDKVVFFPGFFAGDDYLRVLAALDVKLFLVPGSDGTARAVREALACGLPVLSTTRGMLAELVRDGETGRTLPESAAEFSRALIELWRDPALRRAMGEAARRDAAARFDQRTQTETVLAAYRGMLAEVSS